MRWQVVFGVLLAAFAVSAAEMNLLDSKQGCILSGSSFSAEAKGWKLETFHYYDRLADGKKHTCWKAFDSRAPHYILARWRTPVKFNRITWQGRNFQKLALQVWRNGKYELLKELNGAKGEAVLPLTRAERLRLDIIGVTAKEPRLYEVVLTGPEQALSGAKLPEKFLPQCSVEISSVKPQTFTAKAGDTVKVDFQARFDANAAIALPKAYMLLTMSEKSVGLRKNFGDLDIGFDIVELTGLDRTWKNYSGTITLPPWMPSGKTVLRAQIFTVDNQHQIKVSNESLLTIEVPEAVKSDLAGTAPAASIGEKDSWRGFQIGGTLHPPFMNHWCCTLDFERFLNTQANGTALQNIQLYPNMFGPKRTWDYTFKRLDHLATSLLRVRPESYILVGIDMRPSAAWKAENPDEMMLREDGSKLLQHNRPVISYGSDKLLADSLEFLDALINFVNSKPWGSRVVAYQPWSNTENDSYIGGIACNNMIADRSKLQLGDHHPGALKKFREFLRQRYNNDVKALQYAWNDPKVTFENARVTNKMLGSQDGERSFFRNVKNSQAAIDYWTFFPSLLGNYKRAMAEFIKRKTNNKALVFVHYGAVLNNLTRPQPTGIRLHGSNYDLETLLRDKNIDMYVQAMPYHRRQAGDGIVVYQPTSSMALHKRMYMADYDIRTIAAGTLNFGRHRSIYETDSLIKRDLAWMYTRQAGAWFADMSQGSYLDFHEGKSSWIGAAEAAEPAGRMLELFRKLANSTQGHKPSAEMAFFYSMQSPAREDLLNSAVVYYNLIDKMAFKEFTLLGAPYDVYTAEDLLHKELPEYKLYVFMNLFYVTPEQRAAIEKLKRGGKTLVFLYAPGFVGDKSFDVKKASELCNMTLKEIKTPEIMTQTLEKSDHPLLRGVAGQSMDARGWSSCEPVHPEKVTPNFEITDKNVTVLGRNRRNMPVMALKKLDNCNIIYSAVPFLSRAMLRNIAAFAGVHLYSKEDVVMAADNRLLMFHNGCESKRKLKVALPPGVKSVKDAFSGKQLSSGEAFELHLDNPDTRILIVE